MSSILTGGPLSAATTAAQAQTSTAQAAYAVATATANAAYSITASGIAVSNLNISPVTFRFGSWTFETDEPVIVVKGKNPIIRTDQGDINLNALLAMAKRAEAILCLIEEDMKRLEKYPALEQAYLHYKIIDALCQDDDDGA